MTRLDRRFQTYENGAFGAAARGRAAPFDHRPNLVDLLAAEWAQRDVGDHLKRLARKVVWRRRVKAFCLAVAVFCIVYFPLRLLVGAVS